MLQDPTISDILVNGSGQIFIERRGKLEKTVARFRDDAHLMRIIDKIVSAVGRRIDESSPLVDARLADGSRVNVVIPPLALDGPSMSIRRFGNRSPDGRLISWKTGRSRPKSSDAPECGVVTVRLNVLISGGTGSGKTTLLNVVSSFIPEDERIVTIEDSAELQLKQEHVVRLETRPANIEGDRADRPARSRDQQPSDAPGSHRRRRGARSRIARHAAGDEHRSRRLADDGSCQHTPRRPEPHRDDWSRWRGWTCPQRSVRNQIASAIDVVIQLSRLSDGRRKLVSLQEITGMGGRNRHDAGDLHV